MALKRLHLHWSPLQEASSLIVWQWHLFFSFLYIHEHVLISWFTFSRRLLSVTSIRSRGCWLMAVWSIWKTIFYNFPNLMRYWFVVKSFSLVHLAFWLGMLYLSCLGMLSGIAFLTLLLCLDTLFRLKWPLLFLHVANLVAGISFHLLSLPCALIMNAFLTLYSEFPQFTNLTWS